MAWGVLERIRLGELDDGCHLGLFKEARMVLAWGSGNEIKLCGYLD